MHLRKSSERLAAFAHKLVKWFEQNKRSLPWRETSDPYRILVSETMLQQTRVETVVPYYHRFLERFPDVQSLAQAPEQDVMKLWQGLGYYARARNLQRAAAAVVEQYAGQFPRAVDEVRSLPGVGPYTSGAVMSIAFNRPVAAVDGNVLRVMSRYLGIEQPIDHPPVKREITEHVQHAVEQTVPQSFTQALMELGAMVCTPRKPQCLACPIQDDCTAFAQASVDSIPVKRPKRARKPLTVMALWIEQDGRLLVEQRQGEGLLANMWQLPSLEVDGPNGDEEVLASLARRRLAQLFPGHTEDRGWLVREGPSDVREFAEIASAKHIFTHLEWDVRVLRPIGVQFDPGAIDLPQNAQFVPTAQLRQLVWPKVYVKILYDVLKVDVATVTS
ncbi:A/G-specific adenine glycosylase [Alicyclobacillus fastidiosus]|uniref:Adenine DNA glycosylase n=1 Tax=Alicyclobacillus fastidiosus TaxID=392011 RepID=A0ABY6ZHJ5_9BACL|nr:A/G-specific adenine glycosylase [Alicyclobacillus fastidiosus]WAH41591.1 A/G-specific adenine glycosylase [Alicyclobacillus fastidiosus]GMA63252.1 adenine DNA glycosylase [Alicyclobacillus fastidiosus]